MLVLIGSIATAWGYTLPKVDDSLRCGNNVVDNNEICDDGNTIDGDGCDSNCTDTVCGNGITTEGEACDDGNANNTDDCNNNCTVPACGDGFVRAPEACDDGNKISNDGCDANCTTTRCGNNLTSGTEECDDGNDAWYDQCSPECKSLTGTAVCGNGAIEQNEPCDDSNVVNGDECNATCTLHGVSSIFVGRPGEMGGNDGIGQDARVNGGEYLAIWRDKLYLATNQTVRVIDIATKEIKTIAGVYGTASYADDDKGENARFRYIRGITTDGNTIWVADVGNHVLRAIDIAAPHKVTTVAGVPQANAAYNSIKDGQADQAELDTPRGLTYVNGIVYFVEERANLLRSFDPVQKNVSTLAGIEQVAGGADGNGTSATFDGPRHMATNGTSQLYIADTSGAKIRAYDIATHDVKTIAGTGTCGYLDSDLSTAKLHRPRGIAFDRQSLYFTENYAHTIRQIEFGSKVSTLSGLPSTCAIDCTCGSATPASSYVEGKPTDARWNSPYEVVFHPASRSLFVSDSDNYLIRRIQ
jgi:cysteine-rich repeat protein